MHRFSRRSFLGGATTAAALGMPFLGSFAHGGGAPLSRLVIFWTPNDSQWPEQYETPLTPGAPLPKTLPSFLQPLDGFRDRLAVVGDLEDVFGGGHGGLGHALNGVPLVGDENTATWGGGITVDQHIAQSLDVEALTLGVWCGLKDDRGRMSYAAAETPVDPIEHPAVAFDNLFADVDAEPEELAARRQRQHSVLDRIASDLQAFKATAPAEQRPKLEQHLESVRALETKIDNELLASCDPTEPGVVGEIDNALVPAAVRAQLGIIAQALGCGATRVATLQVGRSGGGLITPMWPDEGLEINYDVHGVAHAHYEQPDDPQMLADALAVEKWYSAQLAYFLEQLDAIPDAAGGSLLDHTLVVHAKELGRRHNLWPLTYVLAGGSELLTGDRVWSYADRPHNDLLLTLCHKMGVLDETFGDPSVTTGPLTI